MQSQPQLNILLVDDQPAKLLSYEAILSDLGVSLLKATTANEALEALLQHEVAVVLMDVCMPELDGFELATMIRQHPRFQRTTIIFVSAVQLTNLDQLRGYERGAVDYIPVPVVPEILRARVSVFVDLYRKTRDLEQLNAELELRVAERTAELEATAARLQLADQRKDEFLAMLSHELRNPLAPVLNALAIIRTRKDLDDLTLRQFSVIDRQSRHMSRLLDDLLEMSRITHGRIELRREITQLMAVISAALEATMPAAQEAEHDFDVEAPEEPLYVDVDAARMQQVLFNLIGNAIKYTPRGGKIRITVERDGDSVAVRVRDNGIGIAPEMLPHIFDLFVQSERTLDRSHGGLGIGLTMVRSLVEMHGGSVSAHSEGPGTGCEFVVKLPLVQTNTSYSMMAAPAVQVGKTASRRFLVVDDNVDLATSLAELLGLWGQETRVVHSGTEALAVIDEYRPDVMLLDIGLPDIDGYEVARRIKAAGAANGNGKAHATPLIVALTGYGQAKDRQRALDAGCDDHVSKPCDPDRLRDLLVLEAA